MQSHGAPRPSYILAPSRFLPLPFPKSGSQQPPTRLCRWRGDRCCSRWAGPFRSCSPQAWSGFSFTGAGARGLGTEPERISYSGFFMFLTPVDILPHDTCQDPKQLPLPKAAGNAQMPAPPRPGTELTQTHTTTKSQMHCFSGSSGPGLLVLTGSPAGPPPGLQASSKPASRVSVTSEWVPI